MVHAPADATFSLQATESGVVSDLKAHNYQGAVTEINDYRQQNGNGSLSSADLQGLNNYVHSHGFPKLDIVDTGTGSKEQTFIVAHQPDISAKSLESAVQAASQGNQTAMNSIDSWLAQLQKEDPSLYKSELAYIDALLAENGLPQVQNPASGTSTEAAPTPGGQAGPSSPYAPTSAGGAAPGDSAAGAPATPGYSGAPATPGSGTTSAVPSFPAAGDTSSLTAGQKAKLTPDQLKFTEQLAKDTGLNVHVVEAWVYSEENGSAAQSRQGANNNDWLNIGYTDSATYGAADKIWSNPVTAANATAGWLEGKNDIPNYGTASAGVQSILKSAGQSPAAQIAALQHSGWASSGYTTLPTVYNELLNS